MEDHTSNSRVTRLVNRLGLGDERDQERLVAVVHDELHRLAGRAMHAQPAGHTLQPTELVNEAWLRLANGKQVHFDGRAQFFSFASAVMRSVLVDHARARRAAKRGGGAPPVTLMDVAGEHVHPVDVLDVDEALSRLARLDEDLATIVELRFFGGLNHPEIAAALGTSLRTVERQWRVARAWLAAELTP